MIYRVKGKSIEVKETKTGRHTLTMSMSKGLKWYDINPDIHIIKICDGYGCIMLDTRYHDFLIGDSVPTLYDYERN